MNNEFGRYGLPLDVKYCKRCTMSNQRPSSAKEFENKPEEKKRVIQFDEDGVCAACKANDLKENINWEEREQELVELCNRHRREDGRFDCIIPGSGGKDSIVTAHILKYKYNMNPLLITWPPNLYTNIGKQNFHAWLDSGFANLSYFPNQKVHKILTKNAFLNLGHPFQPFMLGQMNLAPKMSIEKDIPLVIYGENPAEYGSPIEENEKPTKDPSYYSAEVQLDNIYLGGVAAKDIMSEHNLKYADLEAYLPSNPYELEKTKTEVHYLGYYLKWHPQEMYYYSVENTNFEPMPYRVEGSYSKYSSLDDKMDWLHWYTYYVKFGMGRTTNDTCQEIRNGDITRDEGISLIRRFDGEYPIEFLSDCCNYMEINENDFTNTIEKIRTPHLWTKDHGLWKLVDPIWRDNESN